MVEEEISKSPFEEDKEVPKEPKLSRKSRWLKALAYIMVVVFVITFLCTFYFLNKEYGDEIPELLFDASAEFDISGMYDADGTLHPYPVIETDRDEFRILQITDLHLFYGGWPGDNKTFALIKDMITFTEPDLVVFTGDIAFTIFNSRMAERIVVLMKEFDIPYTVTLGNHDCWGKGTKHKIANTYHNDKQCVFPYGPTNIALEPGIMSVGNFPIFIKNPDGDIKYSIICMDTGEKYQGDYAYISEKQKEWYTWLMDGIEQNIPALPSIAFMHITMFEVSLVPAGNIAGMVNERFSRQGKNIGMADEMLKYNVKGVFWGHDHTNDYIADYVNPEISGNILKLVGTRSVGYNGYGRSGVDKGGRLIRLDLTSGEFIDLENSTVTSTMVYA